MRAVESSPPAVPAPAGARASAPGAAPETSLRQGWSAVLRNRLLLVAMAALLLAALLLGAVGLRAVEQRLAAEVSATSVTVGRGLAQQVEVALAAGVPFAELTGVEAFLRTASGFDPRIGFAALLDAEGRLAHAAGAAAGALPEALAAGADRFEETPLLRFEGHLAVPVPVRPDSVTAGYLLVGVEAGLSAGQRQSFLLHAALAVLALLLLLLAFLRSLLWSGLERPAEALAALAAAVGRGDLTQTTWLVAPGPLGRLLAAARMRLAAVNAGFQAFLLSAFAARAGHFEPPVLREITAVVRRALADYRLPPVTGAWPLALGEEAQRRSAFFALLLGEALLLPGWRGMPALQGLSLPLAVAAAQLPLLLALPLGLQLARRLLGGLAAGLVFTAGALIAAAGLLGLALAETPTAVVALRLLGGLGLGLALRPLAGGAPLARDLPMVAVAGVGPGLLALLLLGPQSVAPLAALATAAAALLAGQLLAGSGDQSEAEAGRAPDPAPRDRAPVLLPVAGFAAAAALVPAVVAAEAGPRAPAEVAPALLISLAMLAAALLGRLLAGRPLGSIAAALPSALAALLLAGLAAGAATGLPPSLLAVLPSPLQPGALLLVPALLLASAALLAHPAGQRSDPAGAALAAAAGLALGLLLQHVAGVVPAAALAAALLSAAAFARRPR